METKKDETAEKPSFENAFKRLQEIVQNLEKGEQNLEQSLKYFEEGVQLTRICQDSLQSAELKVQQLLKVSADGVMETKPFPNS
jgi:exodeoxyribonuclease VII small subunit